MHITKKIGRALRGFLIVFSRESSIQIQSVIGVGAIALAWYLGVGRIEFIVLLILCFSVVMVEGVNTVLERVIDLAEPRYHDVVRDIKDAMAGLVLLASLGATIVGVLILLPYLLALRSFQ